VADLPSAPSNAGEFYCGPFDPDELVRWAEMYGDPEQWAKKAQRLHGEVERLREALVMIYRESPAAVARVCDEFLDRSGRLLGEIRQEVRGG
jgi:hypothetical protein